MVLRECEFHQNFAGPDHRNKEALSAHDVTVSNFARVIVEAASPLQPEVMESPLLDVGRELGKCVIATNVTVKEPPSPPPSPPAPGQQTPNPDGLDKIVNGGGDEDGGQSLMNTKLIIIIAVSLGGSAFIMCLVIMCCFVPMSLEDKNLTPLQRGKRNFSRSISTGLKRTGTARPGYVEQGDFIATLVAQQQEAQQAADYANKRAERLQQKLENQQKRRPGSRGYVQRMGQSMGSAFRSLSLVLGRAGSRPLAPMASDVVSTPETNRTVTTPMSQVLDFKLPNQP